MLQKIFFKTTKQVNRVLKALSYMLSNTFLNAKDHNFRTLQTSKSPDPVSNEDLLTGIKCVGMLGKKCFNYIQMRHCFFMMTLYGVIFPHKAT